MVMYYSGDVALKAGFLSMLQPPKPRWAKNCQPRQSMRAFADTGNADYRKCVRCLRYDSPDNLSVSGKQAFHPACNAAHTRKMRKS